MDEIGVPESLLENRNGTRKPGIINRDLLAKLAIEQGAKGAEAKKLSIKDGIKLAEIQQISIEFLRILKIDNLWMMAPSLTRLKLSNNAIERMENLDSLINLTELDLSFNHIRVIENIENLLRLEILLLYSNDISEIGGIDRLIKLKILSVGANKIHSWEHFTVYLSHGMLALCKFFNEFNGKDGINTQVKYLERFKKLRTLNIAGNPCTEMDGYFDHVIAFLPQMAYLNYKMISDSEREIAQQKYQREIAALKDKETLKAIAEKEEEATRKRLAVSSLAYVEYLDGIELFEQMYQNDKEGLELSLLNEETKTAHEEYKDKFTGLCRELHELGLTKHERRSEELSSFRKVINEGQEAVYSKARAMVDEVIARKHDSIEELGKLFLKEPNKVERATNDQEDREFDYDIREKVEQAQYIWNTFNDLLSEIWDRLMHGEVVLHEGIEESTEIHKSNMGDIMTSFTDSARAIFALMRDAQADYNYTIGSLATTYANTFLDQLKMPAHHLAICGDKDVLSNNLATSHDLHLQIIDTREDLMLSKIKNWFDGYTEQLTREENERNRRQILEISHFLQQQREEFDGIQSQLRLDSGDLRNIDILAPMETE